MLDGANRGFDGGSRITGCLSKATVTLTSLGPWEIGQCEVQMANAALLHRSHPTLSPASWARLAMVDNESPITVTLRFYLQKDRHICELQFFIPPGWKLSTADTAGYFVMTAHGPDLDQSAQQAVRYVLDYLVAEYDMSREQAYCFCGAVEDLKIGEIVELSNNIIYAYLPLSIFE